MAKTIALSGIDGSGKSTLATILSRCLEKAKVIWFRWRALTLYALYLYSKLRKLYVKTCVPHLKREIKVHVFYVDDITRTLYPYMLFLDLSLYYLLYRLILLFRKVNVVIYDRFFLDALIDAIYACRCVNKPLLILYLSVQRKVSKTVILDVDVSIALARKKDILSRRELEVKRRLYLLLSEYMGIHIVDASPNLENVVKNVCKIVELSC